MEVAERINVYLADTIVFHVMLLDARGYAEVSSDKYTVIEFTTIDGEKAFAEYLHVYDTWEVWIHVSSPLDN